MTKNIELKEILKRKKESKSLEFKSDFNPDEKSEWCELIKDVVAIANSGGGKIVFGVDSTGKLSKGDLSKLSKIDPAVIMDKLTNYTDYALTDIEVFIENKGKFQVIVWEIGKSDLPIVFTNPGTYAIPGGKQSTAFSRGTVYFRHGAKSEPGTTADIARAFETKLREVRNGWLKHIRRVTTAPLDSKIIVSKSEVVESKDPNATPIRFTDDPLAPAFRVLNTDSTHPFRLSDLVKSINSKLDEKSKISNADIFCVRKSYETDENREFTHTPKFGSPQYSQAFLDWLLTQIQTHAEFLAKARASCGIRPVPATRMPFTE